MQQVVQYHISNGINCIFEIPTEAARQYLPAGIEPVEANHGVSLIGITMFDFSESPAGPYQELVVSLYAVPRLGIMDQHPHAAVTPSWWHPAAAKPAITPSTCGICRILWKISGSNLRPRPMAGL